MLVIKGPKTSRLQLRADVLPDYGKVSILDVCQELHSSVVGASDWLRLDQLKQYIQFLQVCLDTWENYLHQPEFDDLVYKIIKKVLWEAKGHLETREALNDNN